MGSQAGLTLGPHRGDDFLSNGGGVQPASSRKIHPMIILTCLSSSPLDKRGPERSSGGRRWPTLPQTPCLLSVRNGRAGEEGTVTQIAWKITMIATPQSPTATTTRKRKLLCLLRFFVELGAARRRSGFLECTDARYLIWRDIGNSRPIQGLYLEPSLLFVRPPLFAFRNVADPEIL